MSTVPKQTDKYWSPLGIFVSSAQTSCLHWDLRTLPFWMRFLSYSRKLIEFPSPWAPHTSGGYAEIHLGIVCFPALATCVRSALHCCYVPCRTTGAFRSSEQNYCACLSQLHSCQTDRPSMFHKVCTGTDPHISVCKFHSKILLP